MRILIVCQHYYPEQFSITEIAEGFVARGHEVLVVTGKPNYGLWRIAEGYEKITDETINGVRVHRVNLKPRKKGVFSIVANYLSFWRNSKRYVRHLKEEFDVVYSMSLSPVISIAAANLYSKKHKVPHFLHCLDLWPESPVVTGAVKKGSLVYRLLYRWSRSLYEKTKLIMVSSPSFEQYFREELRLENHPIRFVPQPALHIVPSEEKPVFEHRYNFVYAGNIGTIQLVEDLCRATKIAHEKEDIALHLIGMGSREGAVKEIIDKEGLSSFIYFYGPKPRNITAGFYEKSTAICVTLKQSGTVGKTIPNKLTSALSLGKPFLASIGGDGEKILRESNGAAFAKSETPEGIAEAMLELCKLSEEEREKMGERNRQYFADHFTEEKIIDDILQIMEKGQD